MSNTFAYVRVSTKEQNEARQLLAVEEYHIPKRNLYIDKQSGKDFYRPAWTRLMKRIKKGDLIIVKSIDRLGRNYNDILEQWRIITKEKQANIMVLDMPLLDTRSKGVDLTGVFISDLVLQILSYVAQTERENIRQRQAEGIAAAKARGVKFGPKPKPDPPEFLKACKLYKCGELTAEAAAKFCGMSKTTFFRRCGARDGRVS